MSHVSSPTFTVSPWWVVLSVPTILLCAGCATRAKGSTVAQSALECDRVEAVSPLPPRYKGADEREVDVYRGCGRYAMVRCRMGADQTVCEVAEVVTAAEAMQPSTTSETAE